VFCGHIYSFLVGQTFSHRLFSDQPDPRSAGGGVENGILDTGYENAKGVSNKKGVQRQQQRHEKKPFLFFNAPLSQGPGNLSTRWHKYDIVLKSLPSSPFKGRRIISPFFKGSQGDFFKEFHLNSVFNIRHRIYDPEHLADLANVASSMGKKISL